MMDVEKFEFIKKKYGHCASWAVWKEQGETAMSNMGDLNILDPQQNPNLLSQLKPDVVFVGLNISIDIGDQEPFSNFHPTGATARYAKDYKTRFALKDIGTENPNIIAFGIDAHSVLTRNLNNEFNIFQVTHYSYQGLTKEDFRNEIKSLIERIQINSEIRKDNSDVLKNYKEKNVISEEKTLDNLTNKTEQILTELKRIRLLLFVIVFVLIVGFML